MALPSLFKRNNAGPRADAPAEPADAVQRARTRARHRLIGAALLVVVGIIGFPLVFETQPRPIPVDIPIEVPRKDNAPALTMPPVRSPVTNPPSSIKPVEAPASTAAAAPGDVITESREEAGRDVPASAAASAAAPIVRGASQAQVKPAISPPGVAMIDPAPKPEAKTKPVAAAADAARAKALLEGKADVPLAAESGRFVVQVGAFADASAARETRSKAEKLGLKTYTQVANTAAGNRIRVRVGPFGTRDEADRAMAKARDAGLAAVVLTL